MRVFIGIPLDEPARDMLAAWAAPLAIPGRRIPPENWHLTLRFVGHVDAVGVDRLRGALDSADLGEPFAIRFGGISGFPKPSRATVGHVEVDRGVDALTELADTVNHLVDDTGLGLEERPFIPHLTLARVRPPADLRPVAEAGGICAIPMQVDEIALFESRTSPDGAKYTVRDRFRL